MYTCVLIIISNYSLILLCIITFVEQRASIKVFHKHQSCALLCEFYCSFSPQVPFLSFGFFTYYFVSFQQYHILQNQISNSFPVGLSTKQTCCVDFFEMLFENNIIDVIFLKTDVFSISCQLQTDSTLLNLQYYVIKEPERLEIKGPSGFQLSLLCILL